MILIAISAVASAGLFGLVLYWLRPGAVEMWSQAHRAGLVVVGGAAGGMLLFDLIALYMVGMADVLR